MSDSDDSVNGLPLQFPNPVEEAHARAHEFRRLSPAERWKQIGGLMEMGIEKVRNSPRRAEIEQRMAAQEAEWQQIQKKVFSQYGAGPHDI
jgi:hypothetical protein